MTVIDHEETSESAGNILKLYHGDGAQHSKFTKNRRSIQLQWVNFMAGKLYFSKTF